MDSDDSAASEVASETEAYEESFVADEIEEDDAPTTEPRATTTTTTTTTSATTTKRPGPVLFSSSAAAITGHTVDDDASDAYADEEYEADDDAYSVDFEDADDADARAKRPTVRSSSPTRRDTPAPPPPPAIAEGVEYAYSEASFEDESRGLSQSVASNNPRPVVDLSVPVRRDSNGSGGGSPLGKTHLNPNSPHVNLKVLSKPSPIQPLQQPPTSAAVLGLPVPGSSSSAAAAGQVSAAALARLEQESDRSLSLLLRKVESKYQDELEELRERSALLAWKERELKTELRLHREELKMRKGRMEKKRKRAAERRRETETLVERLHADVAALQGKAQAAEQRGEQQLMANEALRVVVEQAEAERRAVEARNLVLAEKLQATLSDFHQLNLKYEDAVGAKLAAERRADELANRHTMACEVLAHKAQIDVDAVRASLERERDAWHRERATLPEAQRAMVENERQRLEKLEAQLKLRVSEMETQWARESVRFEKELALAWESKKVAEDRAEKRLQEELGKLARERDALDEQRRELLVSMTKSSARIDEERGRLDATREQLEMRRLKLVEERAELDAKASFLDDRVHRLAQEESVLEARKSELTKLGRETLDKSRGMAQRLHAFAEMTRELETLRARAAERDDHTAQLQAEKAALEKTARQLQHERLMVAKQRMQSRQFLDGAKKLELLLHQQKALELK